MGIREGRRKRGKEQVRPVMMETKSNKGRRGREREQSNSRRGKEIDGVVVSKRRVQECWIKEINAEEDSGEKGADRQRKEGRQQRRERRDRTRQLGVQVGGEINSFVDLLLCRYLKSNAFFLPFLPSSSKIPLKKIPNVFK